MMRREKDEDEDEEDDHIMYVQSVRGLLKCSCFWNFIPFCSSNNIYDRSK